MNGEWVPPEGSEIEGPPRSNPVVGHIVQRLFNIVHPPTVSVFFFHTTFYLIIKQTQH